MPDQFIADEILATFPAREREIGRLDPLPPRENGQEFGVLVVGVGADHEDPAPIPGQASLFGQARDAAGDDALGRERDDCNGREEKRGEGSSEGCHHAGVSGEREGGGGGSRPMAKAKMKAMSAASSRVWPAPPPLP